MSTTEESANVVELFFLLSSGVLMTSFYSFIYAQWRCRGKLYDVEQIADEFMCSEV